MPKCCSSFNGEAFFVGQTQNRGQALWKSNGTDSGTVLVKDTHPGNAEQIVDLIVGEQKLYFVVRIEYDTYELWQSDGTTAGTTLVESFSDKFRNPFSHLTPISNGIIFTFESTNNIYEARFTDGNGSSSRILESDVSPQLYHPMNYQVVNNQLYFESRYVPTGRVTLFVAPLSLDSYTPIPFSVMGASYKPSFIAHNNKVYFRGEDIQAGIYETDGTTSGTVPFFIPSTPAQFGALRAIDTGIFFRAKHSGDDSQKLYFAQTPSGAVTEMKSFEAFFLTQNVSISSSDEVLFTVKATGQSDTVWKSDGTPQGTAQLSFPDQFRKRVKTVQYLGGGFLYNLEVRLQRDSYIYRSGNIQPITFNPSEVSHGSDVTPLSTVGSRIIYRGFSNGTEMTIWSYDTETEVIEQLFTRDDQVAAISVSKSSLGDSQVLISIKKEDASDSLYVSDGTKAGTRLLTGMNNFTNFGRSIPINGGWLFTCDLSDAGYELCISDGTPNNTRTLADIASSPTGLSSNPFYYTSLNGKIFFLAYAPEYGFEIWVTDGTTDGTELFVDLLPGADTYRSLSLSSTNGKLLVSATKVSRGPNELFSIDPTTREITQIFSEFTSPSTQLHFVATDGPNAYMRLRDIDNNHGLWITDGTPAGTRKFHTPNRVIHSLVATDGALLFSEPLGDEMALMRYDIRCDRLEEITRFDGQSLKLSLNDNIIFLTLSDTFGVRKLYVSDGSASGTTLLSDLDPSAKDFRPGENVEHIGPHIFVNGGKAVGDRELWKLDTRDLNWQGLRVAECSCNTSDQDQDGTFDCSDSCPSDPSKILPEVCGCGEQDVDEDDDFIIDCLTCPNDPNKSEPGFCGCGLPDNDIDGDGIIDCASAVPPVQNLPTPTKPTIRVKKRKIKILIDNYEGTTNVITLTTKELRNKKGKKKKGRFNTKTREIETAKNFITLRRNNRLKRVTVSYRYRSDNDVSITSAESPEAKKRIRKRRPKR